MKYRIVNRFRFTVFVVVVIIAFTCLANFVLGLATVSGTTVQEYQEVKVHYGDTLWDLSERYMPDKDPRAGVHELCKVNDITAAQLCAGMTILVPVYDN